MELNLVKQTTKIQKIGISHSIYSHQANNYLTIFFFTTVPSVKMNSAR